MVITCSERSELVTAFRYVCIVRILGLPYLYLLFPLVPLVSFDLLFLAFSGHLIHAFQSLACETAISTDFSALFSLKHIYVKYKNAILLLIGCFFRT